VDSEYSAGNYEEARRASNTAKILNTIGIAIGSISLVTFIILVVASLAAN